MSIPSSGWSSSINLKTFVQAAMAIGGVVIAGKMLYGIFQRSVPTRTPCPTSRSWLIEMDNPFCPVHRAASIVENSKVQKGMIVLDAGCGPGRVTIPIAQKVGPGGKVVAMDLQEGMLKKAQEKAANAQLNNIQFLRAGLGENRLEPSKFDRVVLVTVLGEIPGQQAAMKELFEALKSKGILSVTEIIFDPDFLRQRTVIRLASEAGFKKIERFGNCIAYTLNFEKP
jgi:ubiquinone/menaquinone biosynthesis C-methylase UbiE